jgi:hypothetical protein
VVGVDIVLLPFSVSLNNSTVFTRQFSVSFMSLILIMAFLPGREHKSLENFWDTTQYRKELFLARKKCERTRGTGLKVEYKEAIIRRQLV